uniref:G patch domain-containing protein 4 n=1 Tax=Iconisemion striatum TaxID=60296 RepID=A0A1A7YJ22_9TELE
MAEAAQEKSRGLKFAEQQLRRHGWEHGKGLGRAENGISEAIKVKVKCDKGGVGHKEGEQFSFHWWDHVFNKASASLQVENDQNGIKVKKTAEEEDGMISNKKPRKALLERAKLYGCFVKSATLLSGQEQPEPKPSVSDDDSSSSDEDDQNLDLSSTTKLSDSDLMKVCGGRTAHKGARHGLTMSAKLARLEQQEAEFMAKYGRKSQTLKSPPVCVTPTPPTDEGTEECRSQKMKKKRSTEKSDEINDEEDCGRPETGSKTKKKKKKDEAEERVSTDGDEVLVDQNKDAEGKSPEESGELNSDSRGKRKKKKRSNRDAGPAEGESCDKESETLEEERVCVKTEKQKKKKSKKFSEKTDEEEIPPKKKKKKSKHQ